MIFGKDLTGQRFGKLVAQNCIGKSERGQPVWRCVCDCGGSKDVLAGNLKNGSTRSCNCLRAAIGLPPIPKRAKPIHLPTYNSWTRAKRRCFNPNHHSYHLYGGRGITMCERWASDYSAFLSDMGERPEGRSLDRIDNDGDYEPGNCRWATQTEQISNSRVTKTTDIGGVKMSFVAFCNLAGISRHNAYYEMKTRNWGRQDFVNDYLAKHPNFVAGPRPW